MLLSQSDIGFETQPANAAFRKEAQAQLVCIAKQPDNVDSISWFKEGAGDAADAEVNEVADTITITPSEGSSTLQFTRFLTQIFNFNVVVK